MTAGVFHREAAAGAWFELSLMDQLGNIGTEVGRAARAKAAGKDERAWNALVRALELFDLTIADDRWKGPRRREICRAREVVCDFMTGHNESASSAESLDRYFAPFAAAARESRADRPGFFDEVDRSDISPMRHNEQLFPFLNRVGGPWFGALRSTLEGWYSQVPAADARGIRQRFRSSRDRQALGAFWELYLFTMFRKLGFSVEIEPLIPGTTRRGDLWVRSGSASAMVEATTCYSESRDSADSRRRGAVYEALDRTESPNFFLSIEIERDAAVMPSMKSVRASLESWLDSLDPDSVTRVMDVDPDWENLPGIRLVEGGWAFQFRAIPKSPRSRGEAGVRPLGVFDPGTAGVVETVKHVRAALVAKAEQTRGVDAPVLIALNSQEFLADDEDFLAALYGDDAIRLSVGPASARDVESIRLPTGFWTEKKLGRRSHVSAVLVAHNLSPSNLDKVEPTVWINPWAARPVDLDLPFRRYEVDLTTGSLAIREATRSAADVLGLGDDWPVAGGPWDHL